jgi:predicted ABC-type ATPase
MRLTQGGHDVPCDRIISRYPRTLVNLHASLRRLSAVVVYDNDEVSRPYRLVAKVLIGCVEYEATDKPAWWLGLRPD